MNWLRRSLSIKRVYFDGMMKAQHAQRELCRKFGSPFAPPNPDSVLGIALNVRSPLVPLNGLRHPEGAGSCGWYIWAGTVLDQSPDFFQPLCVRHLHEWCPAALEFLALAPGWRFLIAGDQVDVWFDEQLLDVP